MFGQRLISFRIEKECPVHSSLSDLNSLDVFLRVHLKDRVNNPASGTTQDLKTAFHKEMHRISSESCKSVIEFFKEVLSVIINDNGRHIENLISIIN